MDKKFVLFNFVCTFATQTGGDERTSRIILMDTPIAHQLQKILINLTKFCGRAICEDATSASFFIAISLLRHLPNLVG